MKQYFKYLSSNACSKIILILILLWPPTVSHSISINRDFTKEEIQSLPLPIQTKLLFYLGDRRPETQQTVDKYMKIYGAGYNGLHHYGMGLIYLNRYLMRPTEGESDFFLKRAIDEFSFNLSKVDLNNLKSHNAKFLTDFFPAMFYKRGTAYFYKNETTKAMFDFYAAIKIKPSYYPAYQMLSNCYMVLGNPKKAKEILDLGKKKL